MNAKASEKEVKETDCQQLKTEINSEGSWRHEHNRTLAFSQAQKEKEAGMMGVGQNLQIGARVRTAMNIYTF